MPLGRGAEGGPDEPGDAGDEEKGTQDDGSYLHLLYHRQRDGLPLQRRETFESVVEEVLTSFTEVKLQVQQFKHT